jgi:hypothetical protein
MTRFPFGSEELGRTDPELDRVAAELESYADQTRATPPPALATRILAAVDAESDPRPGAWARFSAALVGLRRPARALAAVAVLAAAVVGALALAEIADRARTDGFGASSSPLPSATLTLSPTPSPTPSLSATPSPSPTATPSPTASPSPSAPASVVETPEASDDHADETPEPTATDGGEDDHSGPGGGDD